MTVCENPKVTERSPELIHIEVDDGKLAVWEWPGPDPAIVFAHGTGFHGRCWDQVIRRLPHRRVLAPDARGHGRSVKPQPPYHWNLFSRDLAAIVSRLGISGAIGVGHSMGGYTITAVAALRPETVSALLLIDPTIREPRLYDAKPFDTSRVRRRRDHWPSPQVMFHSFRGRPLFERWRPEVLKDYCDYGLLPDGSGYRVACPPPIEASIYECSREREAALPTVIPSVACPVIVLRAGASPRGFLFPEPSPTDPALARRFPKGRDTFLPDLSHFIPMEAPELVAEYICGMLPL
jgi:lipase